MIASTTRVIKVLANACALLVAAQLSGVAQPAVPLTFVAIGDAGNPGVAHRSTAAAVNSVASNLESQRTPLGLMLFLGDNFYPHGLNGEGSDWMRLRDEVLAPYVGVMRRLGRNNVHSVPGNHDYYCRSVNLIPYGFCVTGNEREQAIPEWTYDYYLPTSIRRALVEGGSDSVEFILFDSAYLLTRPTIFWRKSIDSLSRILEASATARGVRWRIFVAHHSPRSVGEHSGWRRWIESDHRVGYVGNCRTEGTDPFRYVYEFFSSQDNCSKRYRIYNRTLDSVIQRSGARVQVLLAGHEHSLQLMHYPDHGCATCPKVFAISGAGSKNDRVKSPAPPHEYTHPLNDDANRGLSVSGFVVGTFRGTTLRLEFIDGRDGTTLDMGGRTSFDVDESGSLVDAR